MRPTHLRHFRANDHGNCAASPPVGISLFAIRGFNRIPPEALARGVPPFITGQIVFFYLVFYVPEIVLRLPEHMK